MFLSQNAASIKSRVKKEEKNCAVRGLKESVCLSVEEKQKTLLCVFVMHEEKGGSFFLFEFQTFSPFLFLAMMMMMMMTTTVSF